MCAKIGRTDFLYQNIMTKAELLAAFAARYSEGARTTFEPVRRRPEKPKRDTSFKHTMYPIKALPELIGLLRTFDDFNRNEKYSIRYLVTLEGKLLLAREGKPDKSIPKHREISPCCLAAGNINFSNDFSMTGITHCSGDFCPDPASMAWPLAVLFLVGHDVSPSFTLEEGRVDAMGNFVLNASHAFHPEEMRAIFPAELSDRILIANRDPSIKVSEYLDPETKAKRSASRWGGFFERGTSPIADLFGTEECTAAIAGAGKPTIFA